jgi:predicted  nucleic acid-binding Zn-ribbon protein
MKMKEQELEISNLNTDAMYLQRKNIQLRGEIQCLNDRIAGLVKENERLRLQLKVQKTIEWTIDRIKVMWNKIRNQFIAN